MLNKWLAILPNPFTDADRAAGYNYDVSTLQVEFSLTQMLDSDRDLRMLIAQLRGLDRARPRQGPPHRPGRSRHG